MQIAKKQARTTSKYAIAKYRQAFSTSGITASQRTKTILFLIVPLPVDPPQYYWPLLHVSRFLYSLKKDHRPDIIYFKIPQDSHCRGTPFLAISIG